MNLNLLRRWLKGNGWVEGEVDDADVIVVCTCGFSKKQEGKELELIEKFGQIKKEDSELVVLGCLPRVNLPGLQAIFEGKTVPTDSIQKFDEIIDLPRKTTEFHNHLVSFEEYSTDPKVSRYFRARRFFERYEWLPFIKVPRVLYTVPSEKWWCVRCSMGCMSDCAYCGVKHNQGPFKSEPFKRILAQIQQGLAKGYKEIALTGEDLGAYGMDLGAGCDKGTGKDMVSLLEAIVGLPGDFEVNIRFVDPVWLLKLWDRLLPVFESGRIKAFCCPVQSGSDRVLELMNRPYTFAMIKDMINGIMQKTKVRMISTNIIVGFPTESRDDLRQTMRLISEVDFGMYQVHEYEERPAARAAQIPEKVDPAEIEARVRIVHKAAVRKHARSLFI